MTRNATKCHIVLRPNEKDITKVDSAKIENRQSEKLLGVTMDSQLSFEKHLNNICGKTKVKLCVLASFIVYQPEKNASQCMF